MSHAVVAGEGSVNAAQRYLDEILQQIGHADSLSAVLYHCMRAHPHHVVMINGATGSQFSNASMLAGAVAGARALLARRLRRACVLAANHEHMLAAQFACLFAGSVPLSLDPKQTLFEMEYFFKLWCPEVIFCDAGCRATVERAAAAADAAGCYRREDTPEIVTLDQHGYQQFIAGHSTTIHDFEVAPPPEDNVVFMVPTSGSTGMPKAALISHRGMVAQLPSTWSNENKFPSPLSRAGLTSSAQWLTWWVVMTMSVVYQVTLVMTPVVITPQTVLELYHKYKVEWGLIAPALSKKLLGLATRESFASVRQLLLAGDRFSVSSVAALQDLLQPGSYVRQGYGMTEVSGYGFVPDESTPLESVGRPLNIFQYKIVDENGQELGPNQKGELWMKNELCFFEGYYRNDEASRESFTDDGWLLTGDFFYKDERDNYYFVGRKKFWFNIDDFRVSPEEVEALVGNVRGVELVCVCRVQAGAAALVVCRDQVTREEIHHAVSKLEKYKRLNSGIAFVDSIPLTLTGKVKRKECERILERLVSENKCFV